MEVFFLLARLKKVHDLEITLEEFVTDCELRELRKKTIQVYEKGLKLFF